MYLRVFPLAAAQDHMPIELATILAEVPHPPHRQLRSKSDVDQPPNGK